ncbi:glutamine--fructose-6-phosphate transaminase (isomerizing) [Yoonia sp.]|uniref:glutamine--fructose-6-phosphate transaminase (isomerizing) n=1 Tax=Yoonia sp. TaxID=2212373 RepID=UPI002E018CD1|nr:glutamine--fructose-6-phosphate transaminase (isomerizing) [Yoonia sp.]
MCGIIGILGHGDVGPELMSGLARLEYRGYDSAGIALMDRHGDVAVRRAVGKLEALSALLADAPLQGKVGIGHTRWATHGAPTEINAHPHSVGQVTLVHNGIIENHAQLRAELEASGVVFSSQTDTEVAAQLLDQILRRTGSLDTAFAELLSRLVGSYALAVIMHGAPDLLYVARQGSPLALGYGAQDVQGRASMYVGSDALALAPFTEQVSYLEDGDWAAIQPDRVCIFDTAGVEVTREIVTVPAAQWSADKGPYRHYMLKEIHEQPESLARLLHRLIRSNDAQLHPLLPELDFAGIEKVTLVACGTAYHACHIAKYWFEELAGLGVEIDIASEYRYRRKGFGANDMIVVVSQSGETADTLAALKQTRGRVGVRVAIVNVPTSSIAREADHVVSIEAGPEIGVASTKAFTGQVLALLGLVLKAAQERGAGLDASVLEEVLAIPRIVMETLALEPTIQEIASSLRDARETLFLGRGVSYPLALEAALKLKEISYIHAQGYAAGELKHGPIALIELGLPVVVFASHGPLQEKTLSNAAEVAARGGRIVHVGWQEGDMIRLPQSGPIAGVFAAAIVAQLLSYHVALAKGTDVDQPRNLAKSVTVE